jgi:hypothetical protein
MQRWPAFVAAAFVFATTTARADDESDRVAAERLAAIVHDQALIDQGTRTGVIAGFIGGAAALVAIGLPMTVDAASKPKPLTNNQEIELVGGAGFLTAGGLLLLLWPVAYIHTPSERLDTRMATFATLPGTERLARSEAALSEARDVERSTRRLASALFFVLAALNAAIVPLEIATNNAPVALINGTACMVGILGGAISLANPGPMERTWPRARRNGQARGALHAHRERIHRDLLSGTFSSCSASSRRMRGATR